MPGLAIPKPLATRLMPYIIMKGTVTRPRSVYARSMIRLRLATGRHGALPAFLIAGTQRGGTTFLYDLLLQHPAVYPALVKEVHYFDRHYANGEAWYRANFSPHLAANGSEPAQITGESTPCYLYHPHAPKRVAELVPDARIIILLRNPVQRAYSHYNLMREFGIETLSFEDALRAEPERIAEDARRLGEDENYFGRMRARYSYVDRGKYIEQVPRWFDYFPASQILILQSEAMYADPPATARQVAEFLGLPDWDPPRTGVASGLFKPRVTTSSQQHASIRQETRDWLARKFEPYNQALFAYLGREFDWEGSRS